MSTEGVGGNDGFSGIRSSQEVFHVFLHARKCRVRDGRRSWKRYSASRQLHLWMSVSFLPVTFCFTLRCGYPPHPPQHHHHQLFDPRRNAPTCRHPRVSSRLRTEAGRGGDDRSQSAPADVGSLPTVISHAVAGMTCFSFKKKKKNVFHPRRVWGQLT